MDDPLRVGLYDSLLFVRLVGAIAFVLEMVALIFRPVAPLLVWGTLGVSGVSILGRFLLGPRNRRRNPSPESQEPN